MLDERHIDAIEYILGGTMLKSEIADRVGISTRTLSRWENDEEFKAELDTRRKALKKTAENKIINQTNNLVDKMFDLAYKSTDQRVKYNAIKYLLDRSLGVPTAAKEEYSSDDKEKNKDVNDLKAEMEEIKKLTVIK
ncbi:helix-turn-helix domain-containing protein [Clostridium tertium]|uniref:helix-turn-helix domain-containing protein n=1 Tax=Clostridium tertium TaxID=1559 RepID=UPI0024B3A458|nr:helix-turn-helix domain-containing protein [Clostridium tertium]MDI9215961.1 helix-turn-helix domain-containing protein [Clostridium tertium]